ncbi:hypothetical protein KAT08_04410 [Candidatus Babeliales bacterium]|nr:hypothetical protein [Candidatus Babeliales bacterium]
MNKKVKFGTDGIRGKANKYPFTEKSLKFLGTAIAQWSIEKYKKNSPKVLIGYDTRLSSPKIKNFLIKGLTNLPLNVVDGQILPTPAVCQLIKGKFNTKNFDFGIIISASHNSYDDNGIKIFDSKNTKLNKIDENSIIKNFEKNEKNKIVIKQHEKSIHKIWNDAETFYTKNILSFFKKDFLKGLKIVIDCANGATYKIAQNIFNSLGASTITVFNNPDGKNINKNCGALHPEKLINTVIENKADAGFAFDGDGDRLISVNKNGKINDGDDILAILSNHPKIISSKVFVGTIMSNLGLDLYLNKNNKQLIRTAVGDKHVCEKLNEKNLLLGGEISGHIIMTDYINSSDGIFASLRVLETIIEKNNLEMKTFKKSPQILINIPILNKKDLKKNPCAKIINEQKNKLKNGKIIIRYSGTENLLRIMVEYKDEIIAKNTAQILANKLKNILAK